MAMMRNGPVTLRLLTTPMYGVSYWDFEVREWWTKPFDTLEGALKIFGRSVLRDVSAYLLIVPDANVLRAVEFSIVARYAGIILNGNIVRVQWVPSVVEDDHGDPQPMDISRDIMCIGGYARRAFRGDPDAIRALTPTHIFTTAGTEELYIRTKEMT
jgi:hypothetical protein